MEKYQNKLMYRNEKQYKELMYRNEKQCNAKNARKQRKGSLKIKTRSANRYPTQQKKRAKMIKLEMKMESSYILKHALH